MRPKLHLAYSAKKKKVYKALDNYGDLIRFLDRVVEANKKKS